MKTYLQKGQRFGRLVIIELHSRKKYINSSNGRRRYRYFYKCLCDCGQECIVGEDALKFGGTKSCGCIRYENSIENTHILNKGHEHGLSNHRIYRIFHGMKSRCYNPKKKSYFDYGARGIKICDEWLNDVKSFYDWSLLNGYKDDLTIERIDVNKDYSPENCTWISQKEQAKNTRRNVFYEYKGEKKILKEWAEEYNLPFSCVRKRICRGWTLEKALNTPNRNKSD